jgi:DNA polymerase-3 subunit alpha
MSKVLLGARSHFSLGESILKPEELIEHAVKVGANAVSLVDTMTVSGMAEFARKCDEKGIQPIVGVRLRVVPDPTERVKKGRGAPAGTFYPNVYIRNEDGLKDVFALLTKAYSKDYFYYVPRIGLEDLVALVSKGNVVVSTGDFMGLFNLPLEEVEKVIVRLTTAGSKSAVPVVTELLPINTPYFDRVNATLCDVAARYGLPVLPVYPMLYPTPDHADAKDVASAIVAGQKLADKWRNVNFVRDFALRDMDAEMMELCQQFYSRNVKFGSTPIDSHWLTRQLNDIDHFPAMLDYRWKKMPVSLPKMAEDEYAKLVEECRAGWQRRFAKPILGHKPAGAEGAVYKARLAFELSVIKKMGFERYFLLVQDLVNWSKRNGIIVGPGRGSVGGSLVAYLIGITDVDPIRFNLLFERFINPDRLDLPDADLDFQSTRRQEVINYLVTKYGTEYVAGISNFSTLASASALRDTGRIHDIPLMELGVTKLVPKEHGNSLSLDEAAEIVAPIDQFRKKHPVVWRHATQLEGVMRNLGRHAAGVVVGGEPLLNRAVVETNRGEGEAVVNWDKRDVEDFGLVKIDVLGLSTLDVLQQALGHIKARHDIDLDLLTLPLDDPKTLDAFGQGKTVGVFQFESSGMRKLLRDLAFAGRLTFEDLAAATSLYRPGPMDSGLMEDYVAIRQGLRMPYYEHPNMESALQATQSVLIYQEQVMQIARDLCGYTFAEADKLRKIMGKKLPEEMAKQQDKFVSGAVSHSAMPEPQAKALFEKIAAFAGYGFNRSHAVEYSVISYWTMYLKVHYPPEFFAASLSILGEDKIDGLVRDARSHGIEVLPPDINRSTDKFEILSGGSDVYVTAPLSSCKGISANAAVSIMEARQKAGGRFVDRKHFESLVEKRKCNSKARDTLDRVGAFAAIEPGQLPPRHPDRRKDQLELLGGLIIDMVKMDRDIVTGDEIKAILVADVIRPTQSCKGCSLAGGVHPVPLLGQKPKFMVVTDCPNYSEEASSKMLSGKASAFLREALNQAGLKPKDGYFTSLVKSPKSGSQLTNEQVNGCSGYLRRELEILKPPIIVALGSSTLQFFAPGMRASESIGKVIYSPKLDANIICGFNPAQIAFAAGKQADLNALFLTVAELVS